MNSASLGQLAVRAKVLPEPDRERLAEHVAQRAKAGTPVSFGHLLLKGGLRGTRLCEVLASGADLDAVRCDACGAETSQARITSRDEYPCPRCGALFFGFLAFSNRPRPAARAAAPALDKTVEYAGVLPLPGVTLRPAAADAAQTTAAFSGILRPPGVTDPNGVYVVPAGEGRRSDADAYSELFRLQAGLPESLAFDADATESLFSIPLDAAPPSSKPAADALPHESVGGFRLRSSLGIGGMGQVFLAEARDGSQVALKLVLPEQRDAKNVLARFRWEAEALERIHHPNVVQVVGSGVDESLGIHYLALEYVQGGSLAELLAKQPMLDEARALRIARGVCLALEVAAERGVVHRDVKPGNILLGRDGEPKLADLGLSKDVGSDVRLTATGLVMGTPAYMAPEQALSESTLDVRADLYALGCCLYEMLTAKVPYVEPGRNLIDVVRKRLSEDLPNVRFVRPDLSEASAALVAGMTRRDRDDRYLGPAQVIRDIDRALAGGDALGPEDTRLGSDAPPPEPAAAPRSQAELEAAETQGMERARAPLPRPLWLIPAAILVVVGLGVLWAVLTR